MRSIRERLNAMDKPAPTSSVARQSSVPIESVIRGMQRSNDRGAYYQVEHTLPDPTSGSLHEPIIRDSILVPNEVPRPVESSRLLFLDTETTGLDRGTGTTVFLVGIGYFEETRFIVRQYFIRELYEESSMLLDLLELLREFPTIVSYNGRSFDWPLLTGRLILHGYRDIPEMNHWDLLHPVRRIWKYRLGDCSLGNLERQLFGIERIGDVPGYLIPQLYFDYLRQKDARPLRPVFSHNQEDIVTLARIADLFFRAENEPDATLSSPVDRLAFGYQLLKRGEFDRSIPYIRPYVNDHSIPPEIRFLVAANLAKQMKRIQRWNDAIAIWMDILHNRWATPEQEVTPRVELAKIYEHQLKDYRSALRWTEDALNLAEIRDWQVHKDALLRRFARLQQKWLRQVTVVPDPTERSTEHWLGD